MAWARAAGPPKGRLPTPGTAPHGSGTVVAGRDGELFGDWVESALGNVEARILRIKGILAMEGVDARVIVQGISEAADVQLGAPWGDAQRTSRMVVLGLGLDSSALEEGFLRCVASPSAAPR